MQKLVVIMLGLVLVAASCGGNKTPRSSAGSSYSSPSPGAGAVARAASLPASVKRAPSGGVNRAKDGTYSYDLSGEGRVAPTASPRTISGQTLTHNLTTSADITTQVETSSLGPGSFTTKTRWNTDRVLLLSVKNMRNGAEAGCEYNPPIMIMSLPLREETIPTQTWKGTGNSCSGKTDVTIGTKESVKDATGHTWSTWKVVVVNEVSVLGVTQTTTDTRSFSPDLGTDVRIRETTQRRTSSGPTSSSEALSVLRTFPS